MTSLSKAMARLEVPGRHRLQSGDSFSTSALIEKDQKVVVFDGDHRLCSLFPLNGALYFRDTKGDFRPVLEGALSVPHSGGLKIRHYGYNGNVTFWFEGMPDATYSKDPMTPFEKKTFEGRLKEPGKVPDEVIVLKRSRARYALLLLAAVGAGTAVVLTRDGCSSAATEESSEAVVED